jgi:hypothetical protein
MYVGRFSYKVARGQVYLIPLTVLYADTKGYVHSGCTCSIFAEDSVQSDNSARSLAYGYHVLWDHMMSYLFTHVDFPFVALLRTDNMYTK